MSAAWFAGPPPGPAAEVLLFCLPYAGGGAQAFRRWPQLLPAAVGVQPVLLPGRERRILEPATVDPAAVADAVQARADRPYAFYGHSMGGRLGLEVTRQLRSRDATLPVRLAVGGARAPDEVDPFLDIVRLPDDEFVDELVALGGTPAEAMADPELRDLLLPALRADLGWLAETGPPPPDPLPVPVDAYVGDADPLDGPAEMAGWARQTTAGFRLHEVPGGHFLVHSPPPELVSRLATDLLAAVRDGVTR
ncbi:MAG: thioesterase II family protein [Mycobacteriales bacterium]